MADKETKKKVIEWIKKKTKEKKPVWITKKKKKAEAYITQKETKNIVDTARYAFKSLKKHYPKIGKDY